MDGEQFSFFMQISDAYTFRNTIQIIKSETDQATMILSPDTIEMSFVNNSKCAVHKIVLDINEFHIYKYDIRNEDGTPMNEFPITFRTNEMFGPIKNISRKDGIMIFLLKGDNKLSIRPIKSSTKNTGKSKTLFVKIKNAGHVRFASKTDYSKEANVKVASKDFVDVCTDANTMKCNYLEIVGQKNGVIFRGILPNNEVIFNTPFENQNVLFGGSIRNISELDKILNNLQFNQSSSSSSGSNSGGAATSNNNSSGLKQNLNIVKSEDLMTIKVPISTVKALSKIHNISVQNTWLKFFFVEGGATKLESPIGTYGTYCIYLRNINTNNN